MFEKIVSFFKKKKLEWYEPEDSTSWGQCPCCDYLSLAERGNDLICPICFWEDNGQDVGELDLRSGPNHGITLREGRHNFKAFGSCDLAMKKHVVAEAERANFEHKPRNI